jgi:murein DD-endopeptidase MepM/ murein hydrolase activator NlpD
LAAVTAATAALGYLGINQIGYIRLVGDQKSAVARAERANIDLQDDIANLRDRIGITARDHAVAEDRASVLASQVDTLRGQLKLTETRLRGLKLKISERVTTQPSEQAAKARPVERVLSESNPSEANPAQADIGAPDNPADAKRTSSGVVELTSKGIGEFERVLASAGVNIARLFSQFGVDGAKGGPFAPPSRADQPTSGIIADGIASIRRLAKALPLSTPLEHYQVGGRFGPRRDPFNRRVAFHTGLDFHAASVSPVYATAPGIVTYAGYGGAYGKVVEIDHGNGIATLCAHMHRSTVSVGQRVEAQTETGLLGSTPGAPRVPTYTTR